MLLAEPPGSSAVNEEPQPSTSQAEVLSTCSSHSGDSGHHSDSSNRLSLLADSPLLWTGKNSESEPLIDNPPGLTLPDLEAGYGIHRDEDAPGLAQCRLGTSKFSLASAHSAATSTSSQFLCRICHISKQSAKDPLVSPCRCSGSMLYVHKACLVHWLELSTRKMVPAPRCELCGYNYRRGNFLHLRRLHLPHADTRDRVLNCLFVFVFSIMVICACMAIHFLHMDQYNTTLRGYRIVSSRLTQEDFIVIGSSILFFVAFFVAIFTQYRAEASIFRLIFRCWVINRNWTIRNYRPEEDTEMLEARRNRALVQANPPAQSIIMPKGLASTYTAHVQQIIAPNIY
ncbi:unnamed protein product, partial [Mesorhabditis spiculigera]